MGHSLIYQKPSPANGTEGQRLKVNNKYTTDVDVIFGC